jgi:hypothetical protein
MITTSRDRDIRDMRVRDNHVGYGMGLGVMLLDDAYPGFPGDVRNPSAFPFPIQYDIATDVSNKTLVWDQDKTPVRAPIIASAKRLERYGCRAIAAECGYFACFLEDVAAAVNVPVFTSSLLQVPFAQTLIGKTKKVATLCAQRRYLTEKHLTSVGIDPDSNLVIGGAQDEQGVTEFDKLWDPEKRPEKPCANYAVCERQMVEATKALVARDRDIGAVIHECTGMQPFSRAAQREVGLPVFDWGPLLHYAYSAVVSRDYYGHV